MPFEGGNGSRPQSARTPRAPQWGMYFLQGKVTPGKVRWVGRPATAGMAPRPPVGRRQTVSSSASNTAAAQNNEDCRMCDFVAAELSRFDTRRKSSVALSVTNAAGVIDVPKGVVKVPPAVVTSVYSSDLRGTSPLMQKLLKIPRSKLKSNFLKKARTDGSIGKTNFLMLIRELTPSPHDVKAALHLYDSFDATHGVEMEFVGFFSYVNRLEGHPDPHSQLSEAWEIMKKEKSICGFVTLYEIQAIFRSLACPPPNLVPAITHHLSCHPDLGLFSRGECDFKDFLKVVESDPFLSSTFINPKTPPHEVALRKELQEEITARMKNNGSAG